MWGDKGSQKYYGKTSVFILSDSEEIRIADSIQWLCLFAVIRLALTSWLLDDKKVVCKNIWETDPLHHKPVFFAASSMCTKRCSVWRKFFEEISLPIWKSNQGTNTACACVYSFICKCISPCSQSRKLSLFQVAPSWRVFPFFILHALSCT